MLKNSTTRQKGVNRFHVCLMQLCMFCSKSRNMVIRIIIPCVQTPLFPTEKIGERDPNFWRGKIGGNKGDYMETIMNNLPPLPFRF